jgi:hypothetical protein
MFGGGEAGEEFAEKLHRIRFSPCGRPPGESEETGKGKHSTLNIQLSMSKGGDNEGRAAGRRSACHSQSEKPMKAQESKLIQANPSDPVAEIVEADLAWQAKTEAERRK